MSSAGILVKENLDSVSHHLKLKLASVIYQGFKLSPASDSRMFWQHYKLATLPSLSTGKEAYVKAANISLSASFSINGEWGNDTEEGQSYKPRSNMVHLKNFVGILMVISFLNLIKFPLGFQANIAFSKITPKLPYSPVFFSK